MRQFDSWWCRIQRPGIVPMNRVANPLASIGVLCPPIFVDPVQDDGNLGTGRRFVRRMELNRLSRFQIQCQQTRMDHERFGSEGENRLVFTFPFRATQHFQDTIAAGHLCVEKQSFRLQIQNDSPLRIERSALEDQLFKFPGKRIQRGSNWHIRKRKTVVRLVGRKISSGRCADGHQAQQEWNEYVCWKSHR